MNKWLIWSFLGAGLIGIVAYLIHGLKTGRKWSTEDAASILGSSIGVAASIQVCFVAIAHWDEPPITGVSTQVFCGGVALGLFAIRAAVKKFQGE